MSIKTSELEVRVIHCPWCGRQTLHAQAEGRLTIVCAKCHCTFLVNLPSMHFTTLSQGDRNKRRQVAEQRNAVLE